MGIYIIKESFIVNYFVLIVVIKVMYEDFGNTKKLDVLHIFKNKFIKKFEAHLYKHSHNIFGLNHLIS